MGFMGSGKSTIGEIIANRLSCSWVDTDQIIEQNQGQKISCLVERFGWPYFREIESNTFKDLIDKKIQVISTGGGLPLNETNLHLIQSNCVSFYLKADPIVLADRLYPESIDRPLINHYSSREELQNFISNELKTRSISYEKADFLINANQPIEVVVEEILNFLI